MMVKEHTTAEICDMAAQTLAAAGGWERVLFGVKVTGTEFYFEIFRYGNKTRFQLWETGTPSHTYHGETYTIAEAMTMVSNLTWERSNV